MKIICVFILFLNAFYTYSQDIHFSQINNANTFVNPSLFSYQQTDYTTQIQTRSQWYSVTTPFKTTSFLFSTKNVFQKFSLALSTLNDVSGDSKFSTDGFLFSISHPIILEKNTLSFGLQSSFFQRSVNYNNLVFLEPEPNQATNFSFFDFAIGASNHYSFHNNSELLSGLAIYHLNQPKQSLIENTEVFLPLKYVFHSTYYRKINTKTILKPTIYYSTQEKNKEFIVGGKIKYKLNNDFNLTTGFFNRVKDAVFISVSLQKQKIEFEISYDINTSTLSNASNTIGAFEFSINYGWNRLNKNKKENQLICPKYL